MRELRKLYKHEGSRSYTEVVYYQNQTIDVPEGWEPFEGTWTDAENEGLLITFHEQAGFVIRDSEKGVRSWI